MPDDDAKIEIPPFPEFCERYLRVENKFGRLMPFKLNPVQDLLTEVALAQQAAGYGVRIIDDKSRQQGSSTWGQAWLFYCAVKDEGQRCLTIAHKQDASSELFEKIQTFYREFPEDGKGLLPDRDQKARGKRLRLMNRSFLYTESAEDKDAGRSFTFQHAHLTEFPLWPAAAETFRAMDPCIPPNVPNTTIFIESTARGRSNFFYELWEQAINKENEFEPVFTPWHMSPEYKRDEGYRKGERKLSDGERALQKEYGLTLNQMLFYRDKLAKHQDMIGREYPWNAEESFASTEDGYFNKSALDWLDTHTASDPIYRGHFTEGGFKQSPDGEWWIFEEPRDDAFYTLSCDPSSGRARDTTGIHVIDATRNTQVASFQGFPTPDEAAEQCVWAGKWHRGQDTCALIIPERNNSAGALLVDRLANDHHYPYIYLHERRDSLKHSMATVYGWHTSETSRNAALENLASYIHRHEARIRCARTLAEMRSFIVNPGKNRPEAGHRATDDLVMALALAFMARPWVPELPDGQERGPGRIILVSDIVGF